MSESDRCRHQAVRPFCIRTHFQPPPESRPSSRSSVFALQLSRAYSNLSPSRFLKMSRHPEVLWAQRSDKVYLTVSLPDAKDVSVKSEAHGLFTFSATGAQGEPFTFSLDLYGTIVPESNKVNIGLRNILCSIQKEKKEWWKRLLKSEEKPAPYIKVDWNRWCDEDEEESINSETLTSDDEDDGEEDDGGLLYLPDLEKARKAM